MGLSAFGYAFVMVSTFGRAQKAAVQKGFPRDIDTYLIISGDHLGSYRDVHSRIIWTNSAFKAII